MPPKGRGKDEKGKANATELVTEKRRSGRRKVASSSAVPDVFKDMLAEAVSPSHVEDRPRKRRRKAHLSNEVPSACVNGEDDLKQSHSDEEESIEFEDVISPKQVQTAYNDSDDASSEDDHVWAETGVGDLTQKFDAGGEEGGGDLDLTLTAETLQRRKPTVTRRKAINNAERAVRLNIHKMHVLCLLSYIDRRNSWCNDMETQSALMSLMTKAMIECLRPKESYTQFGKAESVKKGLALVAKMWESKYSIVAKGMRRAYWVESEREIKEFRLHPDADTLHEKAEFRATAKTLKGSRDVGAQLFCALLRKVGLDVRLVCSLQPLPFTATTKAFAPNTLQGSTAPEVRISDNSEDEEPRDAHLNVESPSSTKPDSPGMSSNPRRRLGHPNAADYFMPQISTPMKTPPKPIRKHIRESQFPVFWVEVLDEAHQKWMPVNPVDPSSVNKTRFFEPPASEPENNMSYVIAFEDDGAARDVTRRYVKAFNAKTRKNRVESTPEGEKWWRKTMRFYSRGYKSDLDQIEDIELAAAEAREPMPKSIADFKDHSVYALERHLRRNEVLVSAREVGKVAAGRDSCGAKKLEGVYRRRDVKLAKSADGWYRMGREVKVGEQSVKMVASRKRDDGLEDEEERAGTALYTENQTELYEPPPVINGRVPKNEYGNLDVYVKSMVPKGGLHLPYPDTSRAALLLGIDYSDAVTGFEFRGRHGTAVIKGAVVAEEYKEAIEATIEGFRDEEAQAEEQRRSLTALMTWRKFMIGLRIKDRVDGYEVEGEESVVDHVKEDVNMAREMDIDDYGGGFLPADEEHETKGKEHINYHDGLSSLHTSGEETIESKEYARVLHEAVSRDVGERDSSEKGDDMGDDDDGDSIPDDNDSGMESEDYIDDGGGGFLSE